MHGEPLKLQRGARTTPPPEWVIGLVFLIYLSSLVTATGRIAFIDHSMNSSLVLTQTTLNFSIKSSRIAFSFLTCNEGQLLYQRGNSGDYIKLYLQNNIFYFSWKSGVTNVVLNVANNLDKNAWYFLDIVEHTGDIKLLLQKSELSIADVVIANHTYRASIFRMNLSGSVGLQIGGTDFTGCVMQGPYVLFKNNPNIVADHILWNDTDCPLTSTDCKASQDIDDCWSTPCKNGGTCNDLVNAYNCTCPHMFNGTNCENDNSIYGCSVLACLNGGTCLSEVDGSRNYKCSCINGFNGINCETSINECASSPCKHGKCIDRVNNYTCDCTGTGYTGPTCNDNINECNTGTPVCGAGTCFDHQGNYSCQCPHGFDGRQCQNNIDDCSSSPCANGGTCSDGVASYTCTCVTGFDGDNCQHNKDDCLGVNCTEPNTECVDGINSHRCECKAGFTGSITSCTDINECSSDPCRNGAICDNLENKYNCVCNPGFTGINCEYDINECSTTPCKNGASCKDLVNSYQCTCAPGFTGSDCDTDIDECVMNSQNCRNGATCVNLVNDYSCNCSSGWTGQHCEVDIDDCLPNPCQNGGACHNYINYYNCTCMPGYEGKNCDIDIDDCSPNPCQHGSSCIDLVNGYNCSCSDGWMGKNCTEVYDACSFAPCKNSATCNTTMPLKDYSCACVSGFSGHDCGINIDDCKPDYCVDPFVCHDLVDNYTCACPTGFTGINCSEEVNACNPSPCLNGGTCTEQINGNYTCECQQTFVNLTKYGNGEMLEFLTGYKGRNCEIDIDECSLTPSICLNEGTCHPQTDGDYVCQCGPVKGFYSAGKYCELRISYCESAESVKQDPPACKNAGTCISGDNGFTCICAPGFTGGRCKTDIDECFSDPCQYNGSCTDQVNGYICDCIPGITGANCETDIDECQSTPCQYNGTCTDKLNGYTCDCIPGITGDDCETDINECASTPCMQGGQCNDKINGYECNCTDTGFNGTECQYNIDDCALLQQPCRNNASCTDLIKDYRCNCFDGYNGKDCEIDIDECISNPCQYNGTCTQRSIQSRPDFSYFTAAGYDCSCIPGITGVNCEIDIDECIDNTCQFGSTCDDQINYYTCICAPGYHGDKCEIEINECDEYLPCENGASCQDKIADYDCMCPEFYKTKQYGGKNCTVELTLCVNNTCMNGATCRPYLISEMPVVQQAYECVCRHGFTGVHCEIPTTMSFNNISFIKHNLAKLTNNTISIRFRTTLSSGILFAWDGKYVTSTLFCVIELWNGMLYITYAFGTRNNAVSKEYHFPYLLNDSYWHEVKLVQTSMLTIELKSSKCSANCSLVVSYTDGSPKNTTWFGKPQNEFKTLKTVSKSNWIGCMEDIQINSAVLTMNLLNSQKTNSVNVESGCLRQEQCFPNSCNRQGTCLDLWNKYKCVCDRKFHGTNCDKEFIPATFAEGDSTSWTSFNITGLQDTLKRTVDVSFLFRTREAAGLIMFLGNQGRTTYITLELYQGSILSRVVLCNYKQAFFINETLFNDGEQHLTQLKMKDNTLTLSIDAFSVSGSISSTDSCDLNANNLYFGGKIPIFNVGRRKRATDFTISVEDISDLSTVGKYKGTIQDIELNTQKLLFYAESGVPSILATNVSSLKRGEVSDDTCSYLPCENNGTCSNVFFNDFNCSCPHGFIGKNCSALDFCKDQSCPTGAECNTLSDGFECISTATFSGNKDAPSVLRYSKHISSGHQINEIMFKLRTIVRNGHVMLIKSVNGHYIIVEIKGGNILVTCMLDNKVVQQITVDLFVGDKSWYTVYLKQVHRTLKLTVSGNDNAISNTSTMTNDAISLQTLINNGTLSTTIELGFTSSISPSAHHYYSGCLREVRIGGILLPFYRQSAFQNFTTDQYFSVSTKMNVQEGCNGGSGCSYSQCKHATSCLADYYGYQCNCTGSGYYGDWCQTNIDSCEADVCKHGQCVDKVSDFYCRCQNGYSGNRCETSADACNPDPCQNNGSCQQENGGFKCNCTSTGFVGQICDVSASSVCSQTQTPCRNGGTCQDLTNGPPSFSCACQDGFTGYTCDTPIDYCTDLPCENGGNCTSTTTGYICDCPAGFSGKNCTDNVNDCEGVICQHGGSCIDIVNGYICNCTDNWEGTHCEINVNECERQPCVRGECRNTSGSFNCFCGNTGYEGQYCDQDINECLTAPCQNDGTCFNFDGGYNCSCSYGYKGKNCETPDCDLVNCENGAACGINSNKWQCNCVKYYFGQLCELKGPCAYDRCNISNTEDCTQEDKVNGTYTCHCKTGWKGVHCDDDINECNLQFCQNTVTCTNTPGDYTCTCQDGYDDKNCSTDIDDCAGKPCKNNAVCTDQVNDFNCDCNNTGYANKTCSDDIDECAQDDKCINKIRCENTPGDYNCICEPGYIGKSCTIKDPDYQKLNNDNDIMWYIIGPVVAVILIAIVVVIIVFVMCARSKRATRGTYSPSRQEVTGSRVELGQVLKPPPEERLI